MCNDATPDELLSPLNEEQARCYHTTLIKRVTRSRGGLAVQQAEAGKGKGVFASCDIAAGTLLFTEAPLVAEQHNSNRRLALVCDHCSRYIGPVHLQLGFRLLSCPNSSDPGVAELARNLLSGDTLLPELDWFPADAHEFAPPDSAHSQWNQQSNTTADYSNQALPGSEPGPEILGSAVLIPDSPAYMFCSHGCAANAWVSWAALLSSDTKSPPRHVLESPYVTSFDAGRVPAHMRPSEFDLSDGSDTSYVGPSDQSARAPERAPARPPWLPGECDCNAARAFYEHAARTNDIFRVAARVVAGVASAALRDAAATGQPPGAEPLRRAWLPYQAVQKAVWWESVPMPEDLDDEAQWRVDLREMALDSLNLLRDLLPNFVPRALLDERVWGSIIGMFELNNLNLTVQSPLELFFLAADALPESAEKRAVTDVTQPMLDALDTEYDACLEGTALYALHSCINHADEPNADATKGDADADGRVVIMAIEDIAAGQEVCMSYVALDTNSEDRATVLRDYGIPV